MNHVPSFIQGITEFLPVSSSLHLELWASLKGLTWSQEHEVSLHLGTLISLCVYFLIPRHWPSIDKIFRLVLATIPAVVVGWLIKRSGWSAPHAWLFFSTILGGCGLLFGEYVARQRAETPIHFLNALCIGFAQVLAFIPGASRMGTTVTMARLLGTPVREAMNFSWMLAIPTVGGAVALTVWDAWKTGSALPINIHHVMVTGVVGFGVLLVVGKHADSKLLRLCGFYRILLGLALFFLGMCY